MMQNNENANRNILVQLNSYIRPPISQLAEKMSKLNRAPKINTYN